MNEQLTQLAKNMNVSADALIECANWIVNKLAAMPNGKGLELMMTKGDEVLRQGMLAWLELQQKLTDDALANKEEYMAKVLAQLAA